jgi:hypothetical protein
VHHVQLNDFGQQLCGNLRTGTARHGNSRSLLNRGPANQIDVRPVRPVKPDGVHDRESAPAEGSRQLGDCRDHRTGTRNRHRSIVARESRKSRCMSISTNAAELACGRM